MTAHPQLLCRIPLEPLLHRIPPILLHRISPIPLLLAAKGPTLQLAAARARGAGDETRGSQLTHASLLLREVCVERCHPYLVTISSPGHIPYLVAISSLSRLPGTLGPSGAGASPGQKNKMGGVEGMGGWMGMEGDGRGWMGMEG